MFERLVAPQGAPDEVVDLVVGGYNALWLGHLWTPLRDGLPSLLECAPANVVIGNIIQNFPRNARV